MSALTDLAKDKDCQIRIPAWCNFDPRRTVPCHAPLMDHHGTSFKVPDLFVTWGCDACHSIVDARTPRRVLPDDKLGLLTKQELIDEVKRLRALRNRNYLLEGMQRTQFQLLRKHPEHLIRWITSEYL